MRIRGQNKVPAERGESTVTSEPLKPVSAAPRLLWVAIIFGIVAAAAAGYLKEWAGLPDHVDLKSYHPKTVSTLYAEDGSVLTLFYSERRFPLALDNVPKHVQEAFVAAEDTRFFSHPGVDPWGIVRAFVTDLETGSFTQGGSTITQQVARSLFLTKEKTISRKLREVILALRIERSNSKAQILETYLNEIYLGRGAHGIGAAAEAYFGKKAMDLTLSEGAYIAGLASNPSKYAPEQLGQPEARTSYVLNAMRRANYISPAQFKQASGERFGFVPNVPDQRRKESYFAEAVRRYIISKYGEKVLYEDGLRVWTTLEKDLQAKAEEAVLRGARAWEERQNRPSGLVKRLNQAQIQEMKSSAPDTDLKPGASIQAVVLSGREIDLKTRPGRRLYQLTVMLKGSETQEVLVESPRPYHKNDLVAFKVDKIKGGKPVLGRHPVPPVQGALVSIENNTGYVRALVGGTAGDKSGFNRALQALRQPGSAFKPIIYSAALEWGRYDPRTIIIDEPIAVKVASGQPDWVPENPDGRFRGPLTFRTALVKSRNIPTVKIAMDLGLKAVIQMAANMGIKSPIKDNLSSALGASEVSPLELTSAFSAFPNMGVKVTPVLIKKITDQAGNVLEDNAVKPLDVVERAKRDIANGVCVPHPKSLESRKKHADLLDNSYTDVQPACRTFDVGGPNMVRVMSPQTAYLMLSILREVTVAGTASAVSKMGRPDLAGKTGTTNNYTDAWFIGFNPRYTTGVWIGYDARDSLGNKEFGAKAALPVWMEYMSYALRNQKPTTWPIPPGIELADNPASSRSVYGRSVMSSAHFAPGRQLKQISRIDAVPAQLLPGHQDFPPWFGAATASVFANSGLIRVLSPTGRTIGFAGYTQDDKGNLVLRDVLPGILGYEGVERRNLPDLPPSSSRKLPQRHQLQFIW